MCAHLARGVATAIALGLFGAGTARAQVCNGPYCPDKKMYPVYAACVELDIPIFINAGVPGPRFPMYPQKVEHIDEVMYDFPELTLVTRHGCEPWTDLAIKLSSNGVRSRDELADLGVDELTEMTGIDAERAGRLIMAARAHWFE